MNQKTNTVMEFNGNKYNLQQLLTIAGSAPSIPVDTLELNNANLTDPKLEDRFKIVFHGDEPVASKDIIVFKQEGKHTILLGHDLYHSGAKRARLVSTPALKKARYEKEAPVGEPATAERVIASTATGAMAGKMQEAFTGRPAIKQERFEQHRREVPPSAPASGYRKAQNSNLSGTPVSRNNPGYSELTSHSTPRPAPTGDRTGLNRKFTTTKNHFNKKP